MNYKARLALLKKRLKKNGLDSLLVANEANVSYLSGFMGRDSMILITGREDFFLTDSRYVEEAQNSLRGFEITLAKDSLAASICNIASSTKIRHLGFEAASLPYGAALRLKGLLKRARLTPTQDIIEDLRSIKDREEIGRIKRSAALTKTVYRNALKSLKAGISERTIARNIEIEFIQRDASLSFEPIVAAGTNASKPHSQPTSKLIRKNSFVMIDLGCRLDGYCSDYTRTVPIGAIIERFAKIYKIVRQAQKKAIEKIREGRSASEVDFAARGFINKQGFGNNFAHSLGHGVGLEIHEKPTISSRAKTILKSGMVVTVEPAIYLPGFGGVRIEDMVLVTKEGCEIIT